MPSMNHLRSAPSTKNAKILMDGFISAALPRSTHQIGACIETEFGLVYESRSGLIALLHRLGLEYHKPDVIPRKLDEEKQKAFIESYNKLLNSLTDNEAAVFADAVHPTHAARPAGCWAPSQEKLAIEQTSGCRIKLHHPALLPAPEPDRAAMGSHARDYNAQQMLRHMRTIRGRHARFLARQSPQELEKLS